MIEKVKSAFETIGGKIGVSATAVGVAVLIALVLLLALVVFLIVKRAKRPKRAAQAAGAPEPADAADVAYGKENIAQAESGAPEPVADEDKSGTATASVKAGEEKTAQAVDEKEAAAAKTAKPAPNKAKAPISEEKQADKAKPAKRMAGKWQVIIKGENAYIAALSASNGEVMLTSEIYSTEEGARSGVATIIKGVATGNFVIYRDKGGDYYYKLKSAGNRLLCVGEIYKSKDACEKAVQTVKRIAGISPVAQGVVEGERFIEYVPAEVAAPAKGRAGKWKIEQSESGGYSAKLYANNGQIMLSTEEVASRKTAEKAVEAVRKNCAEGNFYIDQDKFGRFYYKLHNAQRSVICTGETYDTVESVISAIESVRRFAAYAERAN